MACEMNILFDKKKHVIQMFDVFVQKRRKNDDVVNICFGKFSLRAENSVDHTLDVRWKITVIYDKYSKKKIITV